MTLAAIFGPQHGYRADVQDNMIETAHAHDPTRGVPVYSLYSETREPTAEMLKGLDVLVIDLQDVGSRIYTFVYTMANCLRAAESTAYPSSSRIARTRSAATRLEGPMLLKGFESFVGQFPIPLRHGMTIAELARFFNEACGIGADLTIVPMEGWRRSMYYEDTGLPWVMPSPNVPTVDTAVVYPGAVLFEGTNVSEGRGTTRPFELIGAPWIDPTRSPTNCTATACRACTSGRWCSSRHFRNTRNNPARVVRYTCSTATLLQRRRARSRCSRRSARRMPSTFQWRQPPYEYEHEKLPFDILAGSSELRHQIEAGMPVRTMSLQLGAGYTNGSATRGNRSCCIDRQPGAGPMDHRRRAELIARYKDGYREVAAALEARLTKTSTRGRGRTSGRPAKSSIISRTAK